MKAGVNIMNEVRGAQYKKPYFVRHANKIKGQIISVNVA